MSTHRSTTPPASAISTPSMIETNPTNKKNPSFEEEEEIYSTPVPLSREEASSAEVRKLARALAPSLVAADEIIKVPSDFMHVNEEEEDYDDDDDLDYEVEALGESENLLRQELAMAEEFGHLFGWTEEAEDSIEQQQHDRAEPPAAEEPHSSNTSSEGTPMKDAIEGTSPHSTPNHHRMEADVDDLDRIETLDNNKDLPPIRIPPSPLTIPQPVSPMTPQRDGEASMFATPVTTIRPAIHYTAKHHAIHLNLDRPENGWYRIQLRDHHSRTISDDLHEFCLSVPDVKLRQWFVGFPRPPKVASSSHTDQISPDASKHAITIPPVRTVTIRIRPDVLCGAVMEGVFHALSQELNADVTKRQGGLCCAEVPPAVYLESEDRTLRYPGYRVEARLATSKGEAARYLILRVFHSSVRSTSKATLLTEPMELQSALHIREASALIQRMEMKGEDSKRIHWNSATQLSEQGVQDVVSAHLLDFHRPCPSVKAGDVTLPALNRQDFPIIQSSWRMVETVWDEMDSRGLAFSNLLKVPFGAFPSLRTLDVHYCSQIRVVSRESMTTDLLQSARDLEKFARESELACANMINLLQPTFETYGIQPPSLPKPKPLTEYPLDFVLPQEACPPWGDQVQSALNEIQSWAGNSNDEQDEGVVGEKGPQELSAIDTANAAVRLVMEAFQRQDDLEQSARLGRKNLQVMDRLAKMEAHERKSIEAIQHCAAQSSKALAAASSFKQKSKGIQEVPLLKWSVMVGNSTGTCTVTANHILFSTQLIPVLGGTTNKLIRLRDVDFVVSKTARTSILSPLPETIRIEQDGDTIYNFRPSMGSARLKSFLEVVQNVQKMDRVE